MRSSELRLASRRALAILLLVFAIAVSFAPIVRWIGRLLFAAYFQKILSDDGLAELTLAAAPMLLASIAAIALAIALLRGREHVLRRMTIAVVAMLALGMPIGTSRAMEGDPLLRLTHDERQALTTLLTIDEFEMPLVGFDGHESSGSLAMRTCTAVRARTQRFRSCSGPRNATDSRRSLWRGHSSISPVAAQNPLKHSAPRNRLRGANGVSSSRHRSRRPVDGR